MLNEQIATLNPTIPDIYDELDYKISPREKHDTGFQRKINKQENEEVYYSWISVRYGANSLV